MIVIDYEVIRKNLSQLSRNDYLVLKSNAYGFGLYSVLKIALSLGFKYFAVIQYQDALKIRRVSKDAIILLMGVFDVKKLSLYEKNQICITINELHELEIIRNYRVDVAVKINMGMNRFGLRTDELAYVDWSLPNILNVYGHIARDEVKEFADFQNCLPISSSYHIGASKSLGKINSQKRIGVAIYESAFSFYGKIIKINYVSKGEYIGYDYVYKMSSDGWVGVVDIGYSDGLDRLCSGFTVWINNRYYKLVGNACMNHCFVLLDNNDFLNKKVEFIGKHNHIGKYCQFFNKISHQIYLDCLKKLKKR